jgi:catechol 2,3-dioxygenase-like lactoylglutathione lyase family enzyme
MELGAFSVSLAVKDLAASRNFYEKLGFHVFHGNESHNWLILRNGDHVIGLFRGMFEKNVLTFNPGWNQAAQPVGRFTDIREIGKRLKQQGVTLLKDVDDSPAGPASLMIQDPDGNPILIDQHV